MESCADHYARGVVQETRAIVYWTCENGGISIHGGEMKEKVVVLMELHRAIIYITEMSKQVMKSHLRDAVHMYPVN
jgi:hypothetical protein